MTIDRNPRSVKTREEQEKKRDGVFHDPKIVAVRDALESRPDDMKQREYPYLDGKIPTTRYHSEYSEAEDSAQQGDRKLAILFVDDLDFDHQPDGSLDLICLLGTASDGGGIDQLVDWVITNEEKFIRRTNTVPPIWIAGRSVPSTTEYDELQKAEVVYISVPPKERDVREWIERHYIQMLEKGGFFQVS